MRSLFSPLFPVARSGMEGYYREREDAMLF
jgi:hypothetical protein